MCCRKWKCKRILNAAGLFGLALFLFSAAMPTAAQAQFVHGTILSEGCGGPPLGVGSLIVGQVYTCNIGWGNFNVPFTGDTAGDTQTFTKLVQTVAPSGTSTTGTAPFAPSGNILPFMTVASTFGGAGCSDAGSFATIGGAGALGSGTAPIAKCTLPGGAAIGLGSSH